MYVDSLINKKLMHKRDRAPKVYLKIDDIHMANKPENWQTFQCKHYTGW